MEYNEPKSQNVEGNHHEEKTGEEGVNSDRWQQEEDLSFQYLCTAAVLGGLPAVGPVETYSALSPCSLPQEVLKRHLVHRPPIFTTR